MPKRKKSDHYTSKGQRPNVNKKIRNMVRKHRLENRPIEDVLKSMKFKQIIIKSAKTPKEKAMREKFLEEKRIESACDSLLQKYGEAGLTRAEVIHAVKTDYISTLENKWLSRKKIWTSQQEKKGKNSEKRITDLNSNSNK